jgi:hypothetical protein
MQILSPGAATTREDHEKVSNIAFEGVPRRGRGELPGVATACSTRALVGKARAFALTCSLWAAFACLLVACATVDATTTQYVGAPRFSPSDPASVQILRSEPTRPHVRLGEIVVDASIDPAPSVVEVEQKLRSEAGKLGADAVVVVYDGIQPVGAYLAGPWWGRSIQTVTGRKVVGVAIKYQG